ncbi:PLDc N-terminal domain-containing protein [Macrococcus capreoli]|uniref:PLDc N-terminal domain-containing protein n=1 Tax=Macrococcus capreoli TaxID=2982690 RepID=UPI0021D5DE2C|nr:PLDc N-terminal domain-containing protein [Macrococcus sp. TMW 2.2395]MCU7557684.1 PLDc N-terminal domain-containing protein [Macrococcus sp. TMW 2.2395]
MNTDVTVLKDYLPFLIPLISLQFLLMIFTLVKVIRRKQFKNLNKTSWIFIIIFVNIIGPISYLVSEEYSG